jgi:CRP-like cAMP-binding protein
MCMKSYSPRNRLLLAVPARHLKVLMEDFEFIRCQREQILLDADSSLDHVFFPESGVVSVVAVYADGNIIEMATIAGKVAPEYRPFSARRRHQRGCWFKFLVARRRCLAPRSIAR